MEYLDYYDEDGNYLGYKTSDEVHAEGLWHNIVNFWLYDEQGSVYFQIKKDNKKFDITSTGHVLKGESINDAAKRIVLKNIGIEFDCNEESLADVFPYEIDKALSDTTIWKDRVKANVFVDLYKGDMKDFCFDNDNAIGILRVNAVEALELFETEKGSIVATVAIQDDSGNVNIDERVVSLDDFFVNDPDTTLGKYGNILNILIEKIY